MQDCVEVHWQRNVKNFEASPPSPLTPEEGQDSGSLLQFGWEIVPVEYGFGLVVGVTIGHVVSAKNHDWLIKYFGSRQLVPRRKVRVKGVRRH